MNRATRFEALRTLVAISCAVLIAFGIILLVSKEPFETITTFLFGPLRSLRYMGNVVELAIPLIFAGLAMSVVFQASLFNLGGEGVFFMSATVASAIAIFLKLPAGLHQTLAILAGGIVGIVIMAIPGFFKAKWNASELVTSLMLNSILLGIGQYIMNYHLRDVTATAVISVKYETTAVLSRILPGTRLHSGLIIALLMVVLIYIFLYRTKWGYEIRITGMNKRFADYSGIRTYNVIIIAHLVAGLLAGLGGAIETLGMHQKFEWTGLPGYGFDGALVAMLARNKPGGVVASALFLAYIRVGADMVARLSDVPSEMVYILQGVIILLISAERFLHSYKQRMVLREVKKHA